MSNSVLTFLLLLNAGISLVCTTWVCETYSIMIAYLPRRGDVIGQRI